MSSSNQGPPWKAVGMISLALVGSWESVRQRPAVLSEASRQHGDAGAQRRWGRQADLTWVVFLTSSSPPLAWNHVTQLQPCPSPRLTSVAPLFSSLFFSKLPRRPLTSLHLLVYPLIHPAHLYFHTPPVANYSSVGPVSPPPPPGPPAFHSHHHPSSSSVQTHG